MRSDEYGFNPLQRFLLRQPDSSTAELSRARWDRLLAALFGSSTLGALRSDPAQAWLFTDPSGEGGDAYKLASLQLCLLQSIRQMELLVDRFILHRYVKSAPRGARVLADKLLWLFEDGSAHMPKKIARYVDNQNEKLRRWILNFDLIVDKCFRRGSAVDWKVIHGDRILKTFARIVPVVVRSGRLHSENAVQQFMFPTHPNVLVCISSRFNQLFRNQLIAEGLVRRGDYGFRMTGLFCVQNDDRAIGTGTAVRGLLGDGDASFDIITFAQFIEAAQRLPLDWEQRE